jgi:hypothetical protein
VLPASIMMAMIALMVMVASASETSVNFYRLHNTTTQKTAIFKLTSGLNFGYAEKMYYHILKLSDHIYWKYMEACNLKLHYHVSKLQDLGTVLTKAFYFQNVSLMTDL